MKHLTPIIIAIGITFSFSGCKKNDNCGDPGAWFYQNTFSQFIGDTVEFDAGTNNPDHLKWDSHSTGIFVESGTSVCYDVKVPHMILAQNNPVELIVTNDCGNSSSYTRNISAIPQYPGLWTLKANYPADGRTNAVSFSIGTKGYVGTGIGTNGRLSDFWEWDQMTNTWTQKANFSGGARSEAVGFSIGTKGYIGTGISGTGAMKDFWEWDQASNTWTQKSDYTGGNRQGAVGFSINSKGYIGTGEYISTNFTNDFWEYDPSNDTWTAKHNLNGSCRAYATGFSIGNKGYVGGGKFTTNNYDGLNDFWEYDPSTDTWIARASLGNKVYNAASFSVLGKGYIAGGLEYSGLGYLPSNSVSEFDPANNTWSPKHNIIGGSRDEASGFSIGNRGYLTSGYYMYGYNAGLCNDLWEFDPQ